MNKSALQSGFSLVEVALALLVASVGMLSVMAMFPVGLEANKKAIDEAQNALFASEIMNGIRANAEVKGWAALENLLIPTAAPDMWYQGNTMFVKANGAGTNVYRYAFENTLLDYALRYVLTIEDHPDAKYQDIIKYIRLTVWNGEFGSTTNPAVYYTELFRSKS